MKPVEEIKQLREKLLRRVNERDKILNKTSKVDEVEIKCGSPSRLKMSVSYDYSVWNNTGQDVQDRIQNMEKDCRERLFSGLIDFMLPGFQEVIDELFSYLRSNRHRLFVDSVFDEHLEIERKDIYFAIMELLQSLKRFSVVATRTGEPWKCQ